MDQSPGLRATGRVLLVGPDGAGKTTVLDELDQLVGPDGLARTHLRPGWSPVAAATPGRGRPSAYIHTLRCDERRPAPGCPHATPADHLRVACPPSEDRGPMWTTLTRSLPNPDGGMQSAESHGVCPQHRWQPPECSRSLAVAHTHRGTTSAKAMVHDFHSTPSRAAKTSPHPRR